ncbi:MAG: TraR/DksA family transcriptional regulator [Myxococcales bacterium FL481]|nr:MAG: TraR/DksA family transcriptional regulator [Myxococcales bacterium FL481]
MSERMRQIRAILERERAGLVAGGDVALRQPGAATAHEKVDDDAAPLAEMEQVIASNRNRERAQRLAAIEGALVRLTNQPDTFGVCEVCDEEIPLRRLELMPWARRCTQCQAGDHPQSGGPRRHRADFR